jgi:hypothetical protein
VVPFTLTSFTIGASKFRVLVGVIFQLAGPLMAICMKYGKGELKAR